MESLLGFIFPCCSKSRKHEINNKEKDAERSKSEILFTDLDKITNNFALDYESKSPESESKSTKENDSEKNSEKPTFFKILKKKNSAEPSSNHGLSMCLCNNIPKGFCVGCPNKKFCEDCYQKEHLNINDFHQYFSYKKYSKRETMISKRSAEYSKSISTLLKNAT